MNESTSPYLCHLFICTKNRNGSRKSCADGDNGALKNILKDAIKDRGLKPKVRVSESSCFGLCESGPNLIIHPQKILFTQVTQKDLPEIIARVEQLVAEAESAHLETV